MLLTWRQRAIKMTYVLFILIPLIVLICVIIGYTLGLKIIGRIVKKEVENLDLVLSLYNYFTIDFFNYQVVKTNGHCGIIENELADALATSNDYKFNKIIKDNHILFLSEKTV